MKIIPKLTLALFAGTCAVLGVNGYLRVRREIGIFEAERTREHEMMGRSLAAAVTAVWRSDGRSRALATLDAAQGRSASGMAIRWVPASSSTMALDPATFASTSAGDPVTRIVRGEDRVATWYTYVPIDAEGARQGAIELTDTPMLERRFARSVLADTVKTAIAFALVSALLSYALGLLLLGRPVRTLTDKARRIGRGDFTGPVVLAQRDELADLAVEMNAMCERLASTIDQLRHADRLATIGKLSSGIAHELGTPLNVVAARASMIASGRASVEESRDYARVIEEASGRMTKIIRQLLQFARRKGVKKAPTDLQQLARDTLDLLRPLAAKRDVALGIDDRSGDATALVDAAQAQQVLTNLVVNAIQASEPGGQVTVRIARRRASAPPDLGGTETECLCLAVEDDGGGIPKDELTRVFEPFYTTKDVGEGTGLGLAVAYGIVRDHGGWIDVESEPGIGSTFTVFLPRGSAS